MISDDEASQSKFCLNIFDIGLPDGDGNNLMKELDEKYRVDRLRNEGDMPRSEAAGFVAHLTKPVNVHSPEFFFATLALVNQ
ncbi:MAG: hypothetical protein WDM80_10230 [Limisphaerales bacterium]